MGRNITGQSNRKGNYGIGVSTKAYAAMREYQDQCEFAPMFSQIASAAIISWCGQRTKKVK
jgi:hypothetical protein